VISDIDDTVKISHVLEKKRLMRHTFMEEFQAVSGMAQLYQSWKDTHNASFHYVSSSPWQLYSELASFFSREGFPDAASFHLKEVRLKDRLDRTLLNLFADPMTSKISKISSIMDTFPTRTFILVGDTGERDPEVYGEICRRYPNQVQRVFLRDVTSDLSEQVLAHLAKKEEKRKTGIIINAPDRYDKAFEGVPSETWSVFTDATTIEL
jgi:phosphatidate phosphatase APP1